MTPPFPLNPAPAWYTHADWTTSATAFHGVHYVGQDVLIKLRAAGPTAYSVMDYYGNTVTSGAMSGSATTLDLGTGFSPGWYRVYFTGPLTDTVFGPAYATTNFSVIRNNPNFLPLPAGNGDTGNYDNVGNEPILRSILGMGPGRLEIANVIEPAFSNNNPSAPTSGTGLGNMGIGADYGRNNWTNPASQYLDPARTRYQWCSFNQTVESKIGLPDSGGGTWLNVYPIDYTRTMANLSVTLAAGSSHGAKITVFYPNTSTLVETFDNLDTPALAQTALHSSAYIVGFSVGSVNSHGTIGPVNFGGSNHVDLKVIQTVQWLFPKGVTYFEGPSNEPNNGTISAQTSHEYKLLQLGVKSGNAAAKAIGPCAVDINNMDAWENYLTGLTTEGVTPDVISFHDYNVMTNGNLALGRTKIERFLNLLTRHGLQNTQLWQTEANNSFINVYGVYHPRRARFYMLHALLWEQYGLPRERNVPWYDSSHGFWSYPAWLVEGDGSVNPHGCLYRTLAEETWGKTHNQRLNFTGAADWMYLGSVYTAADTSGTAVLISTSHMDGSKVTLALTGPAQASLEVVDGFGNETTVSVIDGLITVPVDDIPTYVRLPVGVNCQVYSVNPTGASDWGPAGLAPSITSKATSWDVGGSFAPQLGDDSMETDYATGRGIKNSANIVPEAATVQWAAGVSVDRAVVFCGQAWQNSSALVAFTVDTTTDGSTWTTRATVTKPTPFSFLFGSDNGSSGCSRETFWDEQWVFDVPLGGTYTGVVGLRISATACSFGGEPDVDAVLAGGQGHYPPAVSIQEIVIPSASLADTPTVTPKTATFETGTNGATIATGDTGAATAWDLVTGTPKYENTTVAHGTLAGQFGPTTDDWVTWNHTGGMTEHYGRVLIYPSAYGTGPVYVMKTSGLLTLNIQVGATIPSFVLADNVGTAFQGVSYADIGRWYRCEYHVIHDASVGQIWMRVYDEATGKLLETILTRANLNTGAATAKVNFGIDSATLPGGSLFYLDDIAADTDAYLGSSVVPGNTTQPKAYGYPVVGADVWCWRGLWTPRADSYTYQWQSATTSGGSYSNISAATASTYTPVTGDIGKYLRCNVVATNHTGSSSAVASTILGPVSGTVSPPVNVTAPIISGTALVGNTLSCTTGTWTNSPTAFAYQWQTSVDGSTSWTNIASATSPTFLLMAAQDQLYIRCGVLASNAGGSS